MRRKARLVATCTGLALALTLLPTEALPAAAEVSTGPVSVAPSTTSANTLTEFPIPNSNSTLTDIAKGPDGNLWFTGIIGGKVGRITTAGMSTEFPTPNSGGPYGIAAGPDGNLWFAEFYANAIGRITPGGVITEFRIPSGNSQPYGSQPYGIAAGPDGNLWFTESNSNSNNIGRITRAGVVTEFPIPTAGSSASGITAGPDGNLWFTEAATNKIGRITPAGTITEYPMTTWGGPGGITGGPDGNLWFTHGGAIGQITTAGAITNFTNQSQSLGASGIAAGPDGNLWFTEQGGGSIGRITTAGVVTEFPISSTSSPGGITAGPDGNLWFTEGFDNSIGRITTGGAITEFPVPGEPGGISAGPDGNLWFTEAAGNIGRITTAGAITEFLIPSVMSHPSAIAAGPDGNLWFTEQSGKKVGRITPGGVITEFPIPPVNSQPNGITAGPDGNLWFTEIGKIGRITTAGVITEFPFSGYLTGITTGPDGNLWFTNSGGIGYIGRITTAGAITAFSIPNPSGAPTSIAAGADGNLWFTEQTGNNIGRITPAGVVTEFPIPTGSGLGSPIGIAAGPDGNLWFTNYGQNIGKITTAGVITEFPAGGFPNGITAGPDGNLWFTEQYANQIARMTPGVSTSTSTSTVLASSVNPSVVGQNVTYTATVTATAPASGTPTGTARFQDGGVDIPGCTAQPVAAAGTATCVVSYAVPGSHTIVAIYSGDANFKPSTSPNLTQIVNKGNTSTALASSANPSVVGQNVTYTATVTATAPASGTRTGTVDFQDGGVDIAGCGAQPVAVNGNATCVVSYAVPGSHTISAIYSGDANFNPSTSPNLTQTVTKGITITAVTSSINPSVSGQNVTYSATVTVNPPGAGSPTGTINFQDGGVSIAGCGAQALVAGAASCSVSYVGVGTHSIVAIYSGDANFLASTSATLTQTVGQDPTTTALASSVNPSVLGQSVTYTATVTANPPGSGTPTGTVNFQDSGISIAGCGAQALVAAAATCTVTYASSGSHTISGVYSGDANFKPSTSPNLTLIVNMGSTSTALASSVNPSVVGQNVTYTETVTATAPASGTPTGTVRFEDGGVDIAGCTLQPVAAAGTATCVVSFAVPGSHTIVAIYSGDANFKPSTSPNLTQIVNKGITSTALASSANPSVVGQNVTYTATVTATAPASGTPTGTVDFQDGGVDIAGCGAQPVAVNGNATCVVSYAVPGSHTISAIYSGDANFNPSTSPNLTQTVTKGITITAVTSSINPSVAGQSVTYTATVTVNPPGAGLPTGTINFQDGGVSIAGCGAQALVAGAASCSVSYVGVGSHSIVAIYSGDPNFNTSTSPNLTQTVSKGSTATALSSSVNPSAWGQSVTYMATVTASPPGAGTPTGTVTFEDGGVTVAGCVNSAMAAGVATCTSSAAVVGLRSITAVYSGDANFVTSTSAPLTQTVNKGDTSTALGSSANPSVVGQNVTYTATVTATAPASGTATGTVHFQDAGVSIAGCGAQAVAVVGTATCVVSYAVSGSHTISAIYNGDANFNPSTSPNLPQIVNMANTSTALASSANPSVVGQNVTFTAIVTSTTGQGTPAGGVSLLEGSTTLATATLNSSGTAQFTISTLAAGSHSLTASYGGQGAPTASVSAPLTQVVKSATSVAVASSVNPSVGGQSVILTATVTPTSPSSIAPSGFVTFKDGATPMGSGALDSSGKATFSTSGLAIGTHSITANYLGDSTFAGSTSAVLTQTVITSLKLAVTSAPVTLTAGTSSGLITVQLQNASSTPVAAPSGGLNLVLKAASPTGSFRDAGDTTTISTAVIAGGSSSVRFRYRDTFAGTAGITVSTQTPSAATSATQNETVTPGSLAHLGLRPATATVAPGGSKTYTAEGFDVYGNDIGDVTSGTKFSVGPDGSCTGTTCTIPTAGTHTVTGTDGTATGAATLIGDPGPVPTLTVTNGSGMASHTVTFNFGGSDADGDPLTYTINYGDGTTASGSLPSAPLTHTYTSACPQCTVVLSVSDGITQPIPYAVATVDIAPNQPLAANAGDPPTITLGQAAHLDGSNSSPVSPGIDSYTWNFGDGTTGTGPVQDHVYPGPAPKTWTATLTVTGGGSSASATVNVNVLPVPTVPGLTIHVTGDGSPLAGATVVVEDAKNNIFNAVDKGGGVYTINGLPDGSYTVFGYKSRFVPNTASATISGGTGTTTLALTSGAVATTSLTAIRLTPAQAAALGIDTTAPGNQNVYQFELHLAFGSGGLIAVSGVASANGFYAISGIGGIGPGGTACSQFCTTIVASVGGYSVIGNVAEIGGDNPSIIWMIVPGKAQWLKELFDVRILITNLAPAPFALRTGSATLNLPSGLSLADLSAGLPPQQLTKSIADIPGQGSQGADWLIRGDAEGFYNLSADYRAVLDPVGASIQLHAQTVNPIHIWGASALRMIFDADDVAYAGYPYHLRVSLTNVSDVPVFNPMVELVPLETDPNRNYIFQPREQYDQGTDQILPGGTFQTRDYIVAPSFTGSLDVSRSFVAPVGGNVASLSPSITSHRAAVPSSYPGDSALVGNSGVAVSWQGVPEAQGYQIFVTADYPRDFPFASVAQVSGNQTSTVIPTSFSGLIAISTLLVGVDGRLHNVLKHPLIKPRAGVPTLPLSISVSLSNGSAAVSWQPPITAGGSPIVSYTATATPVYNDRVMCAGPGFCGDFQPPPSASITCPGDPACTGALRATFNNLISDCHQMYSFDVYATNRNGSGPATLSPDHRPSGLVRAALQSGQPKRVVILLDGIGSHQPEFIFNPLDPTKDGTPSYCPESWNSTAGQEQEADFRGSGSGPRSFFHKWNWGEIDLNGNPCPGGPGCKPPKPLDLSFPWNDQTTPFDYPGGTTPTHTFLLDQIAASGAVVLPFSYGTFPSSANPDPRNCANPCPAHLSQVGNVAEFFFPRYTADDSGPTQDWSVWVNRLSAEIASIQKVWPGAQIDLIGHSQGGMVAELFWEHLFSAFGGNCNGNCTDVTQFGISAKQLHLGHIISLDAPINGIANAVPINPEFALFFANWITRGSRDAQLIANDAAGGYPFVSIGTRGDHLYDLADFPFDGLETQVLETCGFANTNCTYDGLSGVNSPCPVTNSVGSRYQSDLGIGSNFDVGNFSTWLQDSTANHFLVKFCPGVVARVNDLLGVGPTITLTPPSSACWTPCSVNLRATAYDSSGAPVVGTVVTLTSLGVAAAPLGIATTDSSGVATFSISQSTPEVDSVKASFSDGISSISSKVAILRFGGIDLRPAYQGCIAPCTIPENLIATAIDLMPGSVSVRFTIVSGPDASRFSTTLRTDAQSNAGPFHYSGGGVGTDTIIATFVDSKRASHSSNQATVVFRSPPNTNAKKYVGWLGAFGSQGNAGCTGTVIDSASGSIVLTAAHCVVGFDTFTFVPSLSGDPNSANCATTCQAPFGAWFTTKEFAFVDPRYAPNGAAVDHSFDFAFLIFPGKEETLTGALISNQRLEEVMGSGLPIRFGLNTGLGWTVLGYPGGTFAACSRASSSTVNVGSGPPMLTIDCGDVLFEGASGSPWIKSAVLKTNEIGAVTSEGPTSPCSTQCPQVLGAYLGDAAKAEFALAERAPIPQ